MKKIFRFELLVIFSFLAALQAAAVPINIPPELVVIKPDHLFLPTGFDDNDIAQAVVAGDLGDICVKAGKLHARVDEGRRQIHLRQEALQYLECWCTKLSVPYHQVVELGMLKAGKYEVLVEGPNGSPGPRGSLSIASARSSAPDDFIYAPVGDALIEGEDGNPTLLLRGLLPSRCMTLREVKVVQASESVLEVLPIMDLSTGPGCDAVGDRFESKISLPAKPGKTLVHIRALNGHSINKIMSIP